MHIFIYHMYVECVKMTELRP